MERQEENPALEEASPASTGDVVVAGELAPEHVEDALRIVYEAFAKKLRIGCRDADDFVRLLHDAVRRDACFAATRNGALLGVLTLQAPGLEFYLFRFRTLFRRFSPIRALLILVNFILLHSGPVAGELLVDQLAVTPAARGMGVGSLLLEAAEARGRAMGVRKMTLHVIAENAGAIRLYERTGYRRVSSQSGVLLRRTFGTKRVWKMEKPLA